jgi:hypothetical protein
MVEEKRIQKSRANQYYSFVRSLWLDTLVLVLVIGVVVPAVLLTIVFGFAAPTWANALCWVITAVCWIVSIAILCSYDDGTTAHFYKKYVSYAAGNKLFISPPLSDAVRDIIENDDLHRAISVKAAQLGHERCNTIIISADMTDSKISRVTVGTNAYSVSKMVFITHNCDIVVAVNDHVMQKTPREEAAKLITSALYSVLNISRSIESTPGFTAQYL